MSPWPPPSGLCTPTVARENVVLSVHACTIINAPASLVWSILLDTASYPSWNSFCPKVTLHSHPDGLPDARGPLQNGTSFTFHAVMDSSSPDKEYPSQLRVTDISTPSQPSSYIPQATLEEDPSYSSDLGSCYRVSWKPEGGLVSKGLLAERFHEIIVTGDRQCEVRTWECMGGILARAVKWFYEDTLTKKFEDWCRDLKRISEDKAKEEAGKDSTF